MPAETATPNTLTPDGKGRSTTQGDVPEALQRRYYLDGRGGAGLGFYADAKVEKPAFRDEGKRLAASRNDPNAIRDMVQIAQHRGWTIVTVRGTPEFKREAWLAGRAVGLEVWGYRPTERDVQDLDRRIDRRLAKEGRAQRERGGAAPAPAPKPPERQRDGREPLRVVETVVRARVSDPASRDRILARARDRVAELVQGGARMQPLKVGEAQQPKQAGRERSRTR